MLTPSEILIMEIENKQLKKDKAKLKEIAFEIIQDYNIRYQSHYLKQIKEESIKRNSYDLFNKKINNYKEQIEVV